VDFVSLMMICDRCRLSAEQDEEQRKKCNKGKKKACKNARKYNSNEKTGEKNTHFDFHKLWLVENSEFNILCQYYIPAVFYRQYRTDAVSFACSHFMFFSITALCIRLFY